MSIADLRPSPIFFTTRLLYEMGTRYDTWRAERDEHAERTERLSKAKLSRMSPSRLEDLGIDLIDLL
jgi:hypothetical protein